MGMPEILTDFKHKGTQAIKKSERGIVLLILRDKFDKKEVLKSVLDVSKEYSEKNKLYIQDTFREAPYKVIIRTITQEAILDDALKEFRVMKWNYGAMPSATAEEITKLATFNKELRKNNHIGKFILSNSKSDFEGIGNFTTTGIEIGERKVETQEFTCRLAGIFATVPLTQSATYFVLPEVTKIDIVEDEDERIDNGELILTNDGEKIKIARAVNSKTTIGTGEGKQLKKIKIIEGMDLMKEDIGNTFANLYTGKIINDYDNKMLFFSAVQNGYFKQLEKIGVLDKTFDNTCYLDFEAQKEYLASEGKDVENMSEMEIKKANTDDKVFMVSDVRYADVMEDLHFNVNY